LSFGGSRGRANGVLVDGADAVDNSVHGIPRRFRKKRLFRNFSGDEHYNAEYGRATAPSSHHYQKTAEMIFMEDAFGYFETNRSGAQRFFRGKSIPPPAAHQRGLVPVKQPYTGSNRSDHRWPNQEGQNIFFRVVEYTPAGGIGISSIGIDNFGLQTVTLPTPAGPFPVNSRATDRCGEHTSRFRNPSLQGLAVRRALYGLGLECRLE